MKQAQRVTDIDQGGTDKIEEGTDILFVVSKRHTEIVFLDFAKAFDSVPHNELLYNNRHYSLISHTRL